MDGFAEHQTTGHLSGAVVKFVAADWAFGFQPDQRIGIVGDDCGDDVLRVAIVPNGLGKSPLVCRTFIRRTPAVDDDRVCGDQSRARAGPWSGVSANGPRVLGDGRAVVGDDPLHVLRRV